MNVVTHVRVMGSLLLNWPVSNPNRAADDPGIHRAITLPNRGDAKGAGGVRETRCRKGIHYTLAREKRSTRKLQSNASFCSIRIDSLFGTENKLVQSLSSKTSLASGHDFRGCGKAHFSRAPAFAGAKAQHILNDLRHE
jgi:hypothetical protein